MATDPQTTTSAATSELATESTAATTMGGAVSRSLAAHAGIPATVPSSTPAAHARAAAASAPSSSTAPAAAGGTPSNEEEVPADLESRYWLPFAVDEEVLKDLETAGYLPTREDCSWRSAFGDVVPAPKAGERVILTFHLVRRMALPPSAFYSEVLDHYGLSRLHNTTT